MSQLVHKPANASPAIVPSGQADDSHLRQRQWLTVSALCVDRRFMIFALMATALGLLLLLSLALGSVSIPLDQIVRAILNGESDSLAWTNIVLKFRLPKTLTAMLAGMALGVSGLLMQTYFRNPLAEPFVLGVSSGASLGVALVLLSTGAAGAAIVAGLGFAGDVLLTTAAGLGAGLTMAVVLLVASKVRSNLTLLILGLMFGYLVAAVVSLLLYFALPERIQAYVNWTFGSFSGVAIEQLPLLAIFVCAGLLIAALSVKPLNALLLGEEYAISMGTNLRRMRLAIVLSTALLVSAVTAFCGPIAFIGIAVPHLCRGVMRTSDHRILLPATCLTGSIVALCAALIAEMPGNNLILPLNVITAMLGAPVVMLVILRQFRGQR